jgi:hypothetical protein
VHAADEAPPDLNVPAKQPVTAAPDPVKPASAKQSDSEPDPVEAPVPLLTGHAPHVSDVCPWMLLYCPALQSSQANEDALDCLYLPDAHAATPDPDPVKPAAAWQSDSSSDPSATPVPEFEGQATQLSDVWVVSVLYCPAPQSSHAAEDAAEALYLPGAQAATPLPAPV